MIFNPPKSDITCSTCNRSPLEKKENITLKTNHRQGEDWQYPDLLNRITMDKRTDMDIRLLKRIYEWIYARNCPDLPEKLNQLPGELITCYSNYCNRTRASLFPKQDGTGMVKNAPLHVHGLEMPWSNLHKIDSTSFHYTWDSLINLHHY